MKLRLSSLDLRAIVNELKQRIVGKYIQNFYSMGQRFMFLKLSNRDIILVEPGIRINLCIFYDREISHFCKKLREKCRHARISDLYQDKYNRVVVIDIGRYKIVNEFFSGGNIIVLSNEDTIVDLLRPVPDLGIVKGSKYIWTGCNLDLTYDNFISKSLNEILPFQKEFLEYVEKDIEKNIGSRDEFVLEKNIEKVKRYLKVLGNKLDHIGGFGQVVLRGLQIEEIYPFPTRDDELQLGFSLDQNTKELSFQREDADPIGLEDLQYSSEAYEMVGSRLEFQLNIILFEKTKIEDLIKKNKNITSIGFNSFNAAVEYAYQERKKIIKKRENDKSKKIENAQKQYILNLDMKIKQLENTIYIVVQNRELIDNVLKVFRKMYDNKLEWVFFDIFLKEEKERGNRVALAISDYDLKRSYGILKIDSEKVEIDLRFKTNKIIQELYGKKEKLEEKKQKTIDVMELMINKQEYVKKKEKYVIERRKPYWFERFNYFISEGGDIVIGGKNAQDNEYLVKNYMGEKDWYFHCDIPGSSSIVCKRREEDMVMSCCMMALCYSKSWENNMIKPVFYVDGGQVSKTAPSGEYLKKGSFMIKGKKNIVVPHRIEYGVGILFRIESENPHEFSREPEGKIVHGMVVSGPWDIVKNYVYRVRIAPGSEKKTDICKSIMRIFHKQSESRKEEKYIKQIGIDDYMKVVNGRSKIGKIK